MYNMYMYMHMYMYVHVHMCTQKTLEDLFILT